MKRIVNKTCNIVTSIVLFVAIFLAISFAGVRLLGLQVYIVLSGSMQSMYPVGSLLYVAPVNIEDLDVDDDITYWLNDDTIVTHRIVEVLRDEANPAAVSYRVKGVENQTADAVPIPCTNVLGRAVFRIPLLGYVAYYIQRPPGIYIAIAVGGIFFLLSYVSELMQKEDKNGEVHSGCNNKENN